MTDPALDRLTEHEKAALREIYRFRTLKAAAPHLGISASGVKQRLESAHRKTGLPRGSLIALLGRSEGWLDEDGRPIVLKDASRWSDDQPIVDPNEASIAPAHDAGCSDLGPVEQVCDEQPCGVSTVPSAEADGRQLGEARPVFDHQPSARNTFDLPRLMRNNDGGNGRTMGRRVVEILIWCLIGIMIFCLLIATLTVAGNLGLHLRNHGVDRI